MYAFCFSAWTIRFRHNTLASASYLVSDPHSPLTRNMDGYGQSTITSIISVIEEEYLKLGSVAAPRLRESVGMLLCR